MSLAKMYKLIVIMFSLLGMIGFGVFGQEDDKKFNLLDGENLRDIPAESNITEFILPEQVYKKGFLYAKAAEELKHLSFEQVVQHINYLDSWEAPKEIVDDFPYFLAGYDNEDRPVWMAEGGKYDVRKWVNRGGKDLENVQKYMFQAGIRILKSIAEKDRPDHEVTQGVFFGDCTGFDITQAYHLPTVRFCWKESLRWRDMAVQAMGRLIIVNVPYQVHQLMELARPIAGQLVERVEVFGTNKAKWKAEIRRLLPEDVIPPWYGGKTSFKPVAVYG